MPRRQDRPRGLFPALLKFWRGRRGLSQLDLALHAEVSTRHISFLETGRAKPSEEMVLRLGQALRIPLRQQNEMLVAASLEPVFPEPDPQRELPPAINHVLERMMAQHEPYPLAVMNQRYDVLRTNQACGRLLTRFIADPSVLSDPINVCKLLFDPRGARPFVESWAHTAVHLLARLHRDALAEPHDGGLADLVEELTASPDVPEAWATPDFSLPCDPVFPIVLARDGERFAFLTTLTVFSAPLNVTLEELRIESYYPMDEATEQALSRLV